MSEGWPTPFSEPIELPDGRKLVKLEDGGRDIQKLPMATHNMPHWRDAVEHLLRASSRRLADVRLHVHAQGTASRRRARVEYRVRAQSFVDALLAMPGYRGEVQMGVTMSNPTGDALVAIGLTETKQHLSREEIHAALEAIASPSLAPDVTHLHSVRTPRMSQNSVATSLR